MGSINTLRAVLVGGAALAVLLAAVYGRWLTVVILLVGIVGHGVLWWHLYARTEPRVGGHPRS